MPVEITHGDCRDWLRSLPENGADSCVTDPPYELNLLGEKWDSSGIAYSQEVWRGLLRALKPGAFLLAFSGARTYHRMVCAIEDAGFEIRDQVQWLFGSGMPKGRDVSKCIDIELGVKRKVVGKDNGELKGKLCREAGGKIQFSMPDQGNKRMMGTWDITAPGSEEGKKWDGWNTELKPGHEPICVARKPLSEKTLTKNVLRWGVGGINVGKCAVEIKTGNGDAAYHAWRAVRAKRLKGRYPTNVIIDDAVAQMLGRKPARFFFCPKTSRAERNAGCKKLFQANTHATVKPIMLMRWLCRLVTPPGGLVLEPFMGSGSTCVAALTEGMRYLACELDKEYIDIAKARIGQIALQVQMGRNANELV